VLIVLLSCHAGDVLLDCQFGKSNCGRHAFRADFVKPDDPLPAPSEYVSDLNDNFQIGDEWGLEVTSDMQKGALRHPL
jgi:hypothetical protein